MKYIGYTLVVITNMLLMLFTITSLWGWFVVPLGVVPITMVQAFGINLLVTYYQVRHPKLFKPEVLIKRTFIQRSVYQFSITLMALVLGYIASLFM
jgi:hypothetical protein